MSEEERYRVNLLFQEVVRNYEYYCNLNGESHNFEELPLVDKEVLKTCYPLFRSKNHDETQPYIESFTSGTTGIPFKCIRTKREQIQLSLMISRKHAKWGLPVKHRSIVLSNRVSIYPDQYNCYIEQINRINPHRIQGRFSDLLELSKRVNHNFTCPALVCIQNWGESIQPNHIEQIERAFQAPLYNYYGIEEIYGIAYSDKDRMLVIDQESVYVEIVNPDTHKVVREGELGEIVVTSFFMKSVPYIRYRTGDLGAVTYDRKNNRKILHLLAGRKNSILFKNRTINASIFRYLDRFLYELSVGVDLRYQLVQNSYTSFLLLLTVTGNIQTNELEKRLGPMFDSWLGEKVEVKVQQVSELIKNSYNGKTEPFICQINREDY
ncbi:hypothetical protein [Paenibacillus sp. KN14-4R]|uniref:hypothetical protein n=1 Tax=Paenibacillus sp. KN14-4R TaxID=3445773 RepID=UPI003FA03239